MKKLWILVALICLLVGCGEEEVPRHLCHTKAVMGTEKWWVPTWLDPATGALEALCEEENHGEECPFRHYSGFSIHVWADTVYFTEEKEDGATVVGYHFRKHKREVVANIPSPTWRSEHIFRGEYLYLYERDENSHKKEIKQLHLTDGKMVDVADIPWQIEGNTGFYLIEYDDASGGSGIVGIFSQILPDGKTENSTKELLLYNKTITGICLTPDAIYWKGYDGFWEDPDAPVPNHLYRYDRQTGESTLLGSDYSILTLRLVPHGEYLYGVCHSKEGDVLGRIHGTTGVQEILYTMEEDEDLKLYTPDVVGQYVVVDAESGGIEERLVYDTVNGTCRVYRIGTSKKEK